MQPACRVRAWQQRRAEAQHQRVQTRTCVIPAPTAATAARPERAAPTVAWAALANIVLLSGTSLCDATAWADGERELGGVRKQGGGGQVWGLWHGCATVRLAAGPVSGSKLRRPASNRGRGGLQRPATQWPTRKPHTPHTPPITRLSALCRSAAGSQLYSAGTEGRHGRRRQGAAQGRLGAGAEEEEAPSVLRPAHLHWEAGSHRSEAVGSACASGGAAAGLSGRHSCGICRAAHLTLHSDRCVGRSMLCGWPWLRAGGCGEAHECEVTGLAALLAGLFQCGFKRLTEIQKVAIPHALAG